jgi:rRNA maturation protein Rpf1
MVKDNIYNLEVDLPGWDKTRVNEEKVTGAVEVFKYSKRHYDIRVFIISDASDIDGIYGVQLEKYGGMLNSKKADTVKEVREKVESAANGLEDW